MYFDAHCHLDFEAFDTDRSTVFERAQASGVTGFVVAGVRPSEWPAQRALANAAPGVIWTAGIHPVVAGRMSPDELSRGLAALHQEWRGPMEPSGVGETGLDTIFIGNETIPQQTEAFRFQLALARSLGCPVVLHVVGAHGLALDVLRRDGVPMAGGMVHSFSGHPQVAEAYVKLGLHISFSASASKPNARKTQMAAASVPMDRILVETDSPDQPFESDERNEPVRVIRVAENIAQLRGCDTETILRISARNCVGLFGVKDWPAKSIEEE